MTASVAVLEARPALVLGLMVALGAAMPSFACSVLGSSDHTEAAGESPDPSAAFGPQALEVDDCDDAEESGSVDDDSIAGTAEAGRIESVVSEPFEVAAKDETPNVFVGERGALPQEVRRHILGRSWHEECPVDLDELSLLRISHWDMNGDVVVGEMVVAERVSKVVLDAFERLFDLRFPIARMRRIAHYDGDDDRSMAANNTSAFNCRRVAGTDRWSEHAFGTAIDINPVQNPFVRGDYVAPPAGRAYLDRSDLRAGMLDTEAVLAFDEIGWRWGGRWRSAKDYQHFSESGR